MIKIGSLKAKWRNGWPPTWQINVAKEVMGACKECYIEDRPVYWLY